jgi:hypothetical protein
MTNFSRRDLIRTAASAAALPVTARSYGRIAGANDRIQVGQIGCGHRAFGHRRMLKLSAQTDPNFDLRSVCDIWSVNRERPADHAQELFGRRPRTYRYSEEMLADRELDAVMIATGDHQHAKILIEVVRAGKDCYCEKPMANTLDEAKLARDVVLARSFRSARAGTSTARAGTCPRIRMWPPSARRTPTGSAGSWGGHGGRSIRARTSSSASSRISRGASPTSGTATVPAWSTSSWTRSSRTTPWPTAAFSPGTNLAYHTDEWFRCLRTRKTPNGNIQTGFAHSVALVMATRSYREGKKIYWDKKSEQILDHPSSA